MKLKKGDKVVVLAGKEKGNQATIIKTIRQTGKVVLEGLNMKKRSVKARGGEAGQIVEFAAPIDASNVALLDPKSGKATRIGVDRSGKTPTRIARKSGEKID